MTGVAFTVSVTVFCVYVYETVNPVGKVFDAGRPIKLDVLYAVPDISPFAPEVEVNPKASLQPIVEDNPATVTELGTAKFFEASGTAVPQTNRGSCVFTTEPVSS